MSGIVLRATCRVLRGLRAPARSTLHVALLLGGLAGASASAQQAAPDKELTESQRRLEQIRRERAKLRAELEGIRGRVSGISAELRNLQRQATASANVLGELDFQLDQQEALISQNTRDLLATQDLLAVRRALLQRRLRDIYKRGPLHTTEVLLTARSFSDLLNRYKYLFLVARRDRALMEDVQGLEAQLSGRERALRQSLLEVQTLQREKAREYEQISSLERTQKQALTAAQGRERTAARRMTQLAADERRLSGLIATLETRRKAAERRAAAANPARSASSGTRASSTLTTRDLGNLAWPIDGRVVYRFGRATQPNGTILRWNGVGIGAAAGSPVKSVEEGTVVMAGPFEGYGPTVVLSHGGGYYSLYLYLKEISVKEGEKVARSQVVGTVGGERTPEGPHIEFQIRAPGGQAVDPLGWLRQRSAR